MSDEVANPARLEGTLEPNLSRGLWIVKWLLAIPHFIVLAFLFIGFFVVWFIAFFAILITGRYPRSLFDYNLGVLRWAWRVEYYSYGVLGTDRYPPFTLSAQPDYPAMLDIEYPERLSRGLVLVKWWLLAIPHYIVVGVLVGGSWFAWNEGSNSDWSNDEWHGGGNWGGPGLIIILAVFAGIALLFTKRYPRGLFDFVMGLNRWVFRVIAYAALMTDVYPPFRLDQGGDDHVVAVASPEVTAPTPPGPVEPSPAEPSPSS